jgi:hypothetical protein
MSFDHPMSVDQGCLTTSPAGTWLTKSTHPQPWRFGEERSPGFVDSERSRLRGRSVKQVLKTVRRTIKHSLTDKLHIQLMYFAVTHKLVNLSSPQSFSERVQWLKLYGHLEQFSSYADKYEVRGYVQSKSAERYLIPLIGVWDAFDDIHFESLPEQFVIKATHGCGYNIVVTNKALVDREAMRRQMTAWLSENYYQVSRETQYKCCKPRIIGERYLHGENDDLKDYKFYCFKGKPEVVFVISDRKRKMRIDVLDMNWKQMPVAIDDYPNSVPAPTKPSGFDEMVELAELLSADFPFVRVDLYAVNSQVYFGELSFTPGSGLERKFGNEAFNYWMGSKIDLQAY